MQNIIYVFLGGGLGSIFRYWIGIYCGSMNTEFPWGTFIANFLACLILGFLVGMQIKDNLHPNTSLLFISGFCGGFSTFSTFSNDSLKLFQNQQIGLALIYIGGSIIIGLIAVFFGIKIYNSL